GAERRSLVLTCIAQGVNFGVPACRASRCTAAGHLPNAAAVLRDGSVIALFDDWDPPSRSDSDAVISYTFARSADGGRTVETLQPVPALNGASRPLHGMGAVVLATAPV